MPRVRLHRTFVRDVRRQVSWLVMNGRDEWADDLLIGIEEVAGRLARFPAIGPIVMENERLVLRKIIFRKLPVVAWYVHVNSPPRDVWLVRLFGAHQDRPDPDPSSWGV